jgi:signal transduction histidine kinase
MTGQEGGHPRVWSGVTGAGLTSLEERWEQFYRWGSYVLLALATLISAAVAESLPMSRAEMYAAGLLVLAALALQVWWGHVRRGLPEQAMAGRIYYCVRTALAFVLTLLNPVFAVFAVLGYFDAGHLLPKRMVKAGMLVTALNAAGSQAGGLPPDGPVGWILFGGLFLLQGTLALFFAHLGGKEETRTRERAATIAALERTNARLEQALRENAGLHAQLLLQAREAGVADERRRLAAEIHDTIAQGLTGIIAQLQVVSGTPDRKLAGEHLERAAALARQSLGEARRSVQNLGPAELENDMLPEALKKCVGAWSVRTGVRARFTVTGTEEPLHEEVAATLLRIAQEALANTAKHASAGRAGVTLSYMGDEVSLDVRDDGRGFNPLTLPPCSGAGGFGLEGMRARAERIAGTVVIESEAGQGTAVSARVPLVPSWPHPDAPSP